MLRCSLAECVTRSDPHNIDSDAKWLTTCLDKLTHYEMPLDKLARSRRMCIETRCTHAVRTPLHFSARLLHQAPHAKASKGHGQNPRAAAYAQPWVNLPGCVPTKHMWMTSRFIIDSWENKLKL